jgi:hypothetical protein
MNNPRITQIHTDSVVQKEICAYLYNLWMLLVLFAFGCTPKADRILPQDRLTVEHSIDRETIHVGDPVELVVTAYYPTNGILKLPEIGREKDIVLLKRDWSNVPRTDGLRQSETRYSLTSFRLGEHTICTNAITCMLEGKTFSTNFPKIFLTVESALEKDASSEIADIKPVQKLPDRVPPWFWIASFTALIAFLVGLATTKLWKRREEAIQSAPPVPSHIIALKALDALKKKGLLEQDECKPFYTELSFILRSYLEGRFQLNAPDETTEEIVEEMSRSPELNGTQRNILQNFMRQADMVKFAKGRLDRPAMEAAFNTTRQFVEETAHTESALETQHLKPE